MAWDILLWIGAGLWMVSAITTALNWILIHRLPPIRVDDETLPFASIVVPARNEERAIREAVHSHCLQDYPSFEVIVVDDRSTDATPQILAELQARHAHLQVVHGSDPPAGWLGKPNALEIGRKRARGDWLLFVDADVIYAPDVLRRAVSYAQQQRVGLLFLWPRLITKTWLEATIMSAIYIVSCAIFPSFLASRRWPRWYAVGGGAGNLVSREAMAACGAFESMKAMVVDDVGLGLKVKLSGHRLGQALAVDGVRVRMYEGAADAIHGFAKNIYPALRIKPWLPFVPPLLGLVMHVLPYVGLFCGMIRGAIPMPVILSLVLMHLICALVLLRFRQPVYVALLSPVREVLWWWIMLRSYLVYRRHGLVWRGRTYAKK